MVLLLNKMIANAYKVGSFYESKKLDSYLCCSAREG